MPDWKVALIAAAITTVGGVIIAIVTYFVAPIISARLRRGRDVADTRLTEAQTGKTVTESEIDKAQAEKIRAETRLIEAGELEAKVQRIVDAAILGTTEIIEQQRSEIVDLRNTVKVQQDQIAIMSETINSLVAKVRRDELEREMQRVELESVNAANLRLLRRVEELEGQTDGLPEGVVTP